MRAAAVVWRQLRQHTKARQRSFAVSAIDPETKRLDPFEWLFFPFDGQAVNRKPHSAARVAQRLGSGVDLYFGVAGVAIETVGVSYERPKSLRPRFEIKLPSFMKLTKRHLPLPIFDC